jgi:hypothetical protein
MSLSWGSDGWGTGLFDTSNGTISTGSWGEGPWGGEGFAQQTREFFILSDAGVAGAHSQATRMDAVSFLAVGASATPEGSGSASFQTASSAGASASDAARANPGFKIDVANAAAGSEGGEVRLILKLLSVAATAAVSEATTCSGLFSISAAEGALGSSYYATGAAYNAQSSDGALATGIGEDTTGNQYNAFVNVAASAELDSVGLLTMAMAVSEAAAGLGAGQAGLKYANIVDEGVAAGGVFAARFVWEPLDDTQPLSWQNVTDAQTGLWTPVVDAQTGSWQSPGSAPAGSWVAADDAQNGSWNETS